MMNIIAIIICLFPFCQTGDFVTTIENKDCDKPPIWRIEGKNVLQLFEVVEDDHNNGILYHNTSSVSIIFIFSTLFLICNFNFFFFSN